MTKVVYFDGIPHEYEDGDPEYDKALERVDAAVPGRAFGSVDELDPQEQLYRSIRDKLFARFPLAAFGPGHVCLDDENWDSYPIAINLTLLTLATRSLQALGAEDVIDELPFFYWKYLREFAIGDSVEWFKDHSTEELAATLAALELIRWHENGAQGDAPQG